MAKTKDQLLITIDKELKKRLDSYSKDTLIPRSSLINKLLLKFFDEINLIKNSKPKIK